MASAAPTGRTVLVVEDEPLQRMMAVDMLEDAGFTVLEVADVKRAIAVLEERLDIRVVFTDVDMPHGLDGMRFAALIRDLWPLIEIILTSGQLGVGSQTLPPRAVFFPKPYRHEQVVAQVMTMMAA